MSSVEGGANPPARMPKGSSMTGVPRWVRQPLTRSRKAQGMGTPAEDKPRRGPRWGTGKVGRRRPANGGGALPRRGRPCSSKQPRVDDCTGNRPWWADVTAFRVTVNPTQGTRQLVGVPSEESQPPWRTGAAVKKGVRLFTKNTTLRDAARHRMGCDAWPVPVRERSCLAGWGGISGKRPR